ncbi:MAG: hypothetical protein J5553_05175 [Verrucomicrobia bacterium]|nr:hypothetical protein [Verrucomicrobiota bacterium]
MTNRWNADIIRDTTVNSYRAIFAFESGPDVEVYGDGWRELCDNIRFVTGIEIPMKKYFKFQRLSDWEQIAGIDASHTRPTCVVTMADRKNGWRRERI